MIESVPTVCEHLKPFLTRLKAEVGGTVIAVDTGWSTVKFVIVLDKGPALKELQKLLGDDTPSFIEIGQNDDPHYAGQVEIVCTQCKHGIAWPIPA
jgi:hypothetical protein